MHICGATCIFFVFLQLSVTLKVSTIFSDGTAAPELPQGYTYGFQIPALQLTPGGALLAFSQAYLRDPKGSSVGLRQRISPHLLDGNDGWIDIVVRRSTDGGITWGPMVVVCRNSSLETNEYNSCQQPAPVADHTRGTWHSQLDLPNVVAVISVGMRKFGSHLVLFVSSFLLLRALGVSRKLHHARSTTPHEVQYQTYGV